MTWDVIAGLALIAWLIIDIPLGIYIARWIKRNTE